MGEQKPLANQRILPVSSPEEQARLRAFADAVPAIVFALDVDGRIQFFNKNWLNYTGLTLDKATDSWARVIHPEDMEAVLEISNKSLKDGQGQTWECRLRRFDGKYLWHQCRMECIKDGNNNIVQWFGLANDIDDQKRMAQILEEQMQEQTQQLVRVMDDKTSIEQKLVDVQQLFSSFMQHSPACQWIKDAEGRYVFINERMTDLYNLSETLIGKRDIDWLPEEVAQRHVQTDEQVLRTGQTAEFVDTMLAPEKPQHFLVVKFPIRSADGRNQYVGGIAFDITQRKKYEGQIEELNRKLESGIGQLADANARLQVARDRALEASELKSYFVANISHEIRTPMSGVIGMAELLIDRDLDNESRELAKDIFDCAKSLLEIVNDLLDFSKLEAGRMELHNMPFSVRSLSDEVAKSIATAATQKALDVSVSVDPSIPARTVGDASRLRQVLLNYLHNALKFTDSGSIQLTARLEGLHGRKARIRFAVKDTGIGIPLQAQTFLFEPFVQADGSTTRKYGGTGLGLSICKRLVSLMSGDIGFTSQEGKGSTFWFSVPVGIPPS